MQNLDWLQDLLSEYSDEDYFIFDCPGTSDRAESRACRAVELSSGAKLFVLRGCSGQIELYSHLPVMKQLCDSLKDWGFNICCVYLVSPALTIKIRCYRIPAAANVIAQLTGYRLILYLSLTRPSSSRVCSAPYRQWCSSSCLTLTCSQSVIWLTRKSCQSKVCLAIVSS